MENPLKRKLASFVDLEADDEALLDLLCADLRSYDADEALIEQGERPDHVFLLIEG